MSDAPPRIAGVVKNGSHVMPNACVDIEGTNYVPAGHAVTTVTGYYKVSHLYPANYRVHFGDCSGSASIATKCAT